MQRSLEVPEVPPTGVVDLWSREVGPGRPDPAADRLLAPQERERAARFRNEEAHALFVQGRVMLRQALSTYLGCPPQALRLEQRCPRCGAPEHGKPRLASPASELVFNLSHARRLVVLAVCRWGQVGVDVEWRGRARVMPEVARLLLSATERAALAEIPEGGRQGALLRCWVRKEALVKATGEGLGRDPRELSMPLAGEGPLLCQHQGAQWGLRDLEVGGDHVGAVAVRGQVPRLRWRQGLG